MKKGKEGKKEERNGEREKERPEEFLGSEPCFLVSDFAFGHADSFLVSGEEKRKGGGE